MARSEADRLPEGGKALRVYLLLRDEIANGRIAPGTALPGEQHLARMHSVSRVTIRRALETLAADGLIEKRVGSGSVVLGDGAAPRAVCADLSTLIPQIVQIGETTARLLAFAYAPPPERVARALGLPKGAKAQLAQRVRYLGQQPFSHLTTYVPETIARNYSEADLADTPLFRLLERSGVTVQQATQSVTATLAAPDVAEALEVAPGAALLSLTRVVRDADGRGVEHLSALYRPDLFRLEMELARVGDGKARHWEPVMGDSGAEEGP